MSTSPLEKISWVAGIVGSLISLIAWQWPSNTQSVTPQPQTATASSTQAGTTNIQVTGGGTIVIGAPVTPQSPPPTLEAKFQEAALPNHGPSFDCSKATYRSETFICSSKELAILDLALANAYRDVLARASPDGKADIRNQQKYWIRAIREQCADIPCLVSIYEKRISELKQSLL